MMSHSNTATALRWRARVTRDAIDSTLSLDETDASFNTDLRDSQRRWWYHFCSNNFLSRRRFLLRTILLVAASSLSLYSLLHVSRSWQNALTVTLQLAVCFILGLQFSNNEDCLQQPLTTYRKQQAATRRRLQAVQEKQQAALHKIRIHQTSIEKVTSVLQEIALYATDTMSVDDMIRISEEQKTLRRDLIEASRRELLRDVVSILVEQRDINWKKHPTIPAPVFERIVQVCKSNPALEFDEKGFRELLVDESDEIHLLSLLRAVSSGSSQWRWTPERLLKSMEVNDKET